MKFNFLKPIFLVILLVSLNACANYKLHYSGDEENWEKTAVLPDLPLAHTMYLVGDAGYSPQENEGINPVLTYLKTHLQTESKNSSLVFLGDNIYPEGMPRKKAPERAEAERRLIAQLDVAKTFPGRPFFVAGNHDWYANGLKGLERQEKYITKILGKKSFLPKNGCPIEKVDISEEIVLIIIDSEWYLTNWDKHPTINDNCEIKTRTRFFDEFEGLIKKYLNFQVKSPCSFKHVNSFMLLFSLLT